MDDHFATHAHNVDKLRHLVKSITKSNEIECENMSPDISQGTERERVFILKIKGL